MRDLLHQALKIYPEHAASFYILGVLYEKLPGWPISFGSNEHSVSLARKSIDANLVEFEKGLINRIKYAYHIELARHLKERNWSTSKRSKEQSREAREYDKKQDVLEKNFYYEGVVEIKEMSDYEEALELLRLVIRELEKNHELKWSQVGELKDARTDLAAWTK